MRPKMKKSIASLITFSLFVLSGCVAPFSSNFTGRSLGKGKRELEIVRGTGEMGGLGGLKFTYGMTSNFDIGLQIEPYSIGLFGKQSFINSTENGFSSAALFGLGGTGNGLYLYTGPVLSYEINFFEPYFVGRYNYVYYNETKDIWSGDTYKGGEYSYFQFTFGIILWITRKIGLSFEVSTFSGNTVFIEFEEPIYLGGLKLRF
jgi:hypothetical protein